ATTDSAQLLATVGAGTGNSFNGSSLESDNFINFLGVLVAGRTTESEQQFYCLAAGKWQNMACYVENNGFDADATVRNRISGQDGHMLITVAVGHSGYFEDTSSTNHDSVGVGDLLDYALATTASLGTTLTMDWIGAH